MKLSLMLCFVFVTVVFASAQEQYVFESSPITIPKIEQCPEDNYLSENVRMKLEQFNLIYTRKVERGSPQYMAATEIIKPDLYYSIQKLTRYFCKCMKKGTIGKASAESELASILDKCFQIVSQDTTPLEAELRATNNPEEMIHVFAKITIR